MCLRHIVVTGWREARTLPQQLAESGMQNGDTRGADHPSSTLAAFDEKKLEGDVLSAISRLFAHGEQFSGHDHRRYMIKAPNNAESESESFIEVLVKLGDGRE